MKKKYKIIFFVIFSVFFLCQSATALLFDNLIQNGDAETGDASSWTNNIGTLSTTTSGDWGTTPPPAGGSYFFWGGTNLYTEAYQTVDVSALSVLVDSGNIRFNLSGYMGGYQSQEDQSALRANFYDDSNNLLSFYEIGNLSAADRGSQSIFLFENQTGTLTAGTRSVEFLLSMTRDEGSDNDGYADNLSFTLKQVPEPAGLFLFAIGLLSIVGLSKKKK